MSSKSMKQKSQGKKKDRAETEIHMPSTALCHAAASPAILPNILSLATSTPVQDISAEEVLQACIQFRTSHRSPSDEGVDASAKSDKILYPSVDQMPTGSFDEEEKLHVTEMSVVTMTVVDEEEKQEVGMESSIVTAGTATIPTSAAAVFIEADDPVMRKLMEEERIVSHARMESLVDSHEAVADATFEGEEWAEDAKPAAQVAYASARNASQLAEITEHEVHPADIDHEVQAELVGEADYSFQHAVATPMMPTVAVAQEDYTTEEATVLDSKPAAAPSGWHNESAEATVLDASPQHQIVWTTQTQDTVLEEIAVTGVDEAEATVVEFAEELHPSDLDATGVQAELIGRDYSHGASLQDSQAWIEQEEPIAAADATNGYAVATARGVASMETYDISNSAAEATVVGISEEVGVNGSSMVNGAAQATAVDILEDIGVNDRSTQATIVEITEDIHPADLEGRGVEAEPVGSQEVSAWAELEHHISIAEASGACAVATATDISGNGEYDAGEAQATVVAIDDEFHPSDLGALAELIGQEFVRAESLPETPHAQALPLISARVRSNPRSVSAPDCQNPNPLIDNPQDTPAIAREGLAAHDATESPPYQAPPTKFIPPPPIPSRSASSRAQSHNSTGSRMSSLSSAGEGGGTDVRPGVMTRAASTSSHQNAEIFAPARRATQQVLSNVVKSRTNVVRTTNNVMERLFGSDSSRRSHDFDLANAAGSILPRTLLPWSVFPSETTGMWVATVNTNQKALDSNNIEEASKALRAFSVPTKQQAEALARAWAPPRMLPFPDSPKCFVCEAKFAVFKRPCHCRNCGVCICSGCVVQWPSKMIPDTYNVKKESIINICKSCDWLCSAFRMAMLDGHYDRAVAIHATSNVNLVTPFANVKGELFYPVHCAVLGGSLELLQWLVDVHCCPLRSIRISGKNRQSSGSFTPVLTSRGRSLLGIAMEKEKIDLVRYLVVDKGMPLTGEKDLNMGTLIRILDRLLRAMPGPSASVGQMESNSQRSLGNGSSSRLADTLPPRPFGSALADTTSTQQTEASWRADEALAFDLAEQLRREEDSQGSVEDACIICFANSIDCVVTPCGHQICCMTCSKNISRCPVCGVDCSFIRVFRANA